MLYVSSACSSKKKIGEAVEEIARLGIYNIELTGGTTYYDGFENDLLRLQDKYGLRYLVHNYFPPPQKSFVLNLASLSNESHKRSIKHCIEAVKLSKRLGGKKIGFHAGFLVEVKVYELGKTIARSDFYDLQKAMTKFLQSYEKIREIAASENIKVYIENNVFSNNNLNSFGGQNPFLLTSLDDYEKMQSMAKFDLLLDVAHLKVSCNSLNLDFASELSSLMLHSDYIHLSDNNALEDQNNTVDFQKSGLRQILSKDLGSKTLTFEIYRDLEGVLENYTWLENYLLKS